MTGQIQVTLKELLDSSKKYENYRKSMKPVYYYLLLCVGLENCGQITDFENWQVEKFRVRPKFDHKSGILWKTVEEITLTYWAKNDMVAGEVETLNEIHSVLQKASNAENEAQTKIVKDLQTLYSFFDNGYEQMKNDAIKLAERATTAEVSFVSTPKEKKKLSYEKAALKFRDVHEQITNLVSTLEASQKAHVKAIESIFKHLADLNTTLTEVYKKMEGMPSKKFATDPRKRILMQQEEKKIEAECEKQGYISDAVKSPPEEGQTE